MLRRLEAGAWVTGIVMLAIFVLARGSSERARLDGIAAIEPPAPTELSEQKSRSTGEEPDVSTWSPARIALWRQSGRETPEAVLRVPSVGLSVPVFDGTSEINLNRGAGRIEGTAQIGARGNIGLAAHRDGYFRALKDVRIGDTLNLTTPREMLAYRIVSTSIVDPEAIEVLSPSTTPSVTLVTCYPFYFVGSAPQRFIVRAELVDRHVAPH